MFTELILMLLTMWRLIERDIIWTLMIKWLEKRWKWMKKIIFKIKLWKMNIRCSQKIKLRNFQNLPKIPRYMKNWLMLLLLVFGKTKMLRKEYYANSLEEFQKNFLKVDVEDLEVKLISFSVVIPLPLNPNFFNTSTR